MKTKFLNRVLAVTLSALMAVSIFTAVPEQAEAANENNPITETDYTGWGPYKDYSLENVDGMSDEDKEWRNRGLSFISKDMSAIRKAYVLFHYVGMNTYYDYDLAENGGTATAHNGQYNGSCIVYSALYGDMLEICGVRSAITGSEVQANHGWNIVEIDGNWYNVDATWGDQGNRIDDAYFLVSDRKMKQLHSFERSLDHIDHWNKCLGFDFPVGVQCVDTEYDNADWDAYFSHNEDEAYLHMNDGFVVPPDGYVATYRIYYPLTGKHRYFPENAALAEIEFCNTHEGYSCKMDGVAWFTPEKSDTTIYSLYNPNAGDLHYTADKSERDTLVSLGWKDDTNRFGAMYSDDSSASPVYRVYNPNAKGEASHLFTKDKGEKEALVKLGWRYEGIAWYAK